MIWLLRLLLAATFRLDDEPVFSGQDRVAIALAPARTWRRAIDELQLHRMFPLIASAVDRHGLAQSVPADLLKQLHLARDDAAQRTRNNMAAFGRLLDAARHENLQPLVLKSTALVAMVGPRLLAHPMNDIDLYVFPQQMSAIQRLVEQMGFVQRRPGADALNYVHPDDPCEFDVHHAFRLFSSYDLHDLIVSVPTAIDGLESIYAFEPNAMLVHLACHMNEHRSNNGYQLRWLHDLAIVLQYYHSQFDMQRIDELLPDRRSLCWLLRLVGFLHGEIRLPMPPALRDAAQGIPPITLGEVLRSLRPATWPLCELRGWVRMATFRMTWNSGVRRTYPRLRDLLAWPADTLRQRRALAATPHKLVDSPRQGVTSASR